VIDRKASCHTIDVGITGQANGRMDVVNHRVIKDFDGVMKGIVEGRRRVT